MTPKRYHWGREGSNIGNEGNSQILLAQELLRAEICPGYPSKPVRLIQRSMKYNKIKKKLVENEHSRNISGGVEKFVKTIIILDYDRDATLDFILIVIFSFLNFSRN